jgi:pilus assembly protein CpaF
MLLSDYDYLLPQVQAAILQGGVEIPKGAEAAAFPTFQARLASILAGVLPRADGAAGVIPTIAARFARMLVGVGVLQPLLEDAAVEEVLVRPPGQVFVERAGRVEALGQLAPDEHFYRVAAYIADTRAGRMLSPQYPVVLVDLAGGERFTALTPPLSPEGTIINIRRWHTRRFDLAALAALGTFGAEEPGDPCGRAGAQGGHWVAVDTLAHIRAANAASLVAAPGGKGVLADTLANIMAANAASLVVSGAFSTGKTTLLNALLAHLPAEVMVAVAESFRELDLRQPGTARVVVPPFVREDAARITLAQAVNSLLTRTRPDVMVLGEITDHAEAREFLRAGNLGVRAMATIHGNSAASALVRLADLAIREGVPLRAVREQVADAVDLVVHMARQGSRRYVAEVAWVRGVDDAGHFRLDLAYRAGRPRAELLADYLAPLRV